MLENDILLTFLSAILCVFSRALLNVMDRIIFFKHEADFLLNMALNTVFPFFLCYLVSMLLNVNYEDFFNLVLNLNIFLAALMAQIVAYTISYAFKRMPIQNIALVMKTSDILIPVAGFLLSNKFNIIDYSFSLLTTFAFTPIFFASYRNRLPFLWFISVIILCSLLLQVIINTLYPIQQFSKDFNIFVKLMVIILFWRTIFSSVLFLYKKILFSNYLPKINNYYLLISRSILAFCAQATFFFSITKNSSNIAWPILNSTPIVTCLISSIFLSEKISKEILITLMLFIFISCNYLLIK